MPPPILIEYRPHASDYIAGFRRHLWRGLRYRFFAGGLTLIAILQPFTSAAPWETGVSVLLATFSLIVGIVCPIVYGQTRPLN